ncbi:hypothetical protein M427DRAFT_40562 [Gonapodya prolifera JEL478]|uniref:SH3 domain-containing protein n=1 Tax=Gonapodya prolifera (strain JEL478) TaxID=1344416 RepID=A0A139AYC7_GONPJ|nr:hypothetical protein M427DRAFT_40562 [Gonapodya prolifera JEL478]|eukprot:KXS21707.1 hypothetical protein M427DRAFT_40562 [Gonapodya prolifera JEL478]
MAGLVKLLLVVLCASAFTGILVTGQSTVTAIWQTQDCTGLPFFWEINALDPSLTPRNSIPCTPVNNITNGTKLSGSIKLGCIDILQFNTDAFLTFPSTKPYFVVDSFSDNTTCKAETITDRVAILADGTCVPSWELDPKQGTIGAVESYLSVQACGSVKICSQATKTVGVCEDGTSVLCTNPNLISQTTQGAATSDKLPAGGGGSPIGVGAIIGIVFGAIGAVALIVFGGIILMRRTSPHTGSGRLSEATSSRTVSVPLLRGPHDVMGPPGHQSWEQQDEHMIFSYSSSAALTKDQLDNMWKGTRVTVVQPYLPSKHADELILSRGDPILVREAFADGWATGQNLATGVGGYFPLACVARLEDDTSDDCSSASVRPIPSRSTFQSMQAVHSLPMSETTQVNSSVGSVSSGDQRLWSTEARLASFQTDKLP